MGAVRLKESDRSVKESYRYVYNVCKVFAVFDPESSNTVAVNKTERSCGS